LVEAWVLIKCFWELVFGLLGTLFLGFSIGIVVVAIGLVIIRFLEGLLLDVLLFLEVGVLKHVFVEDFRRDQSQNQTHLVFYFIKVA
jgi:hypothetical protein